jgi:hypothetical protein
MSSLTVKALHREFFYNGIRSIRNTFLDSSEATFEQE